MNHLHKTQPSRAPKPPAGVVQATVQFTSSTAPENMASTPEAARSEWFIQGTQQNQFAMNTGANYAYMTGTSGTNSLKITASTTFTARIIAPTSGTIIALDPDIPPNRQRVTFTSDGSKLRWLVDGKPFANGSTAQWLPWPGRHVIQLAGERGEVLDEVRVEVRGAGIKGLR
jgi:penicillin-binding protein 1C